MAPDGDGAGWMCGGTVGMATLRRINLHRPRKKMLKPEKWQTIFDGDGKILCFRKILKLIILGGVDPSIRAEVWEFLLGCYTLGSTTEYRRQLRMARRERYEDLVRQCRLMHSSIGTGTLAYVVGSKVMDMRTPSKNNDTGDASVVGDRASGHSVNQEVGAFSSLSSNFIDTSKTCQRTSICSTELFSHHEDTSCSAYGDLFSESSSKPHHHMSKSHARENPNYISESYDKFPALPVTDLFQISDWDGEEYHVPRRRMNSSESFADETMHSFHISNNVDLVMESHSSFNDLLFHERNAAAAGNSETTPDIGCKSETVYGSSRSIAEESRSSAVTSRVLDPNEDRVSEWRWTLHRIVVDVVRTDIHLDFYGDTKNMARMSDILAVYAWVDPATGYCQGMSDLLSPFVVLYEDDADAFWCFEMLLRRMRANFRIEGPTGVIKQLQALSKILELTDSELYDHLLLIGAESLHFAFRMLLVLFRRELSFNEALCMWEMMWAADFDNAVTLQLEKDCLEPLVLHIDEVVSLGNNKAENMDNGEQRETDANSNKRNRQSCSSSNDETRYASSNALCGLTRANFWMRHDQMHVDACTTELWRAVDDEMPVFCAAAIFIINRNMIMRETSSIDDVIKMFNDNRLKIRVERCVRLGIKLRKKYIIKLIRQTSTGSER